MKKKKADNFLDYVPKRNKLYDWDVNQKKHVEVAVINRGFYNRIAQLIFHKPKISKIELDDFGSFVWQEMDGKKSIYEIGSLVKAKFGKKAEPLYERLCEYVKTLHNNRFIVYENKKKNKNKSM